jgi:hypothetical protein
MKWKFLLYCYKDQENNLKIIKTQKKWALHRMGYPVAIRFNSMYGPETQAIEAWLRKNRGPEQFWESGKGDWKTHGLRGWYDKESGQWNRACLIGLRSEAEALIVMLANNFKQE